MLNFKLKYRSICYPLAMMSIMSSFACSPLTPNKIPLGPILGKLSGVIGYWTFDELTLGTAPGGADFADASGNGHHGKASGTLQLGSTGIKGKAITSNGTGSIIIPMDLSKEKTISVSFWVKPNITATNPSNVLFEYTPDSTSGNGFFASLGDNSGILPNSMLLWMHGGSGFFGQTLPTLPNSIWHNILVVYDQSNASQNTITLTVDGMAAPTVVNGTQSTDNNGTFANSNLYLLCRGGTSLCLNADIDELIVWNRVITAEELSSVYANLP